MFLSLGGEEHRFRDPLCWFCYRLGGVDPLRAMNVKGLEMEEKAMGSRSYVFDFVFFA
jgi:hypothetical protein